MGLWLSLSPGARASDCQAPVSTLELQSTLDRAIRALSRLEPEAFREQTDRLDAQVPCLSEVISRHLSAEIHRIRGIRAVGDRDPDAPLWFAAARALEPSYTLPSDLIPDGNPVRLSYGAFDLSDGQTEVLPSPASGVLRVDGQAARHRPLTWPTILQLLGDDGAVRWTADLAPGAPTPLYPVALEPSGPPPQVVTSDSPPPPPPTEPQLSPRAPLLVAAGGGLVISGLLYGLAGAAEARFDDPATPDAALIGLRRRANSLVIATGFVGATSAGVGIVGLTLP